MAIDKYTHTHNLTVLANAAHLVAQVVTGVAGEDVSNHIDGELISQRAVGQFAAAAFNKELNGSKKHA